MITKKAYIKYCFKNGVIMSKTIIITERTLNDWRNIKSYFNVKDGIMMEAFHYGHIDEYIKYRELVSVSNTLYDYICIEYPNIIIDSDYRKMERDMDYIANYTSEEGC